MFQRKVAKGVDLGAEVEPAAEPALTEAAPVAEDAPATMEEAVGAEEAPAARLLKLLQTKRLPQKRKKIMASPLRRGRIWAKRAMSFPRFAGMTA